MRIEEIGKEEAHTGVEPRFFSSVTYAWQMFYLYLSSPMSV
jgi:hypothetical protein